MTNYSTQILPSGDSAVLIRFGENISESDNHKVITLQEKLETNKINGVIETIPAYSSLMVLYNPLILSFKTIYRKIQELLNQPELSLSQQSRKITVPVCYDEKFGSDLLEVAGQIGLSIDEIIKIYTSSNYRVFMLGFTPGFPYMGETDERISCQRKAVPRQVVPEGSVGLAGRQTGIYPIESPGGWQIIGRTPLNIFNPGSKDVFLFRTGDIVHFKAIGLEEFEAISRNQKSLWKG